MGRIEYEYPLFKVYYSNNSNNSNIRGNPALGSHYSGSVRLLSPLVSDFSIKSAATGPGPATGHLLPALQIRAAAYQHPAARGQHSHRGTIISIIH